MNSKERHEARFQRRVKEREKKKDLKLSQYDDFNLVANIDNLYEAFKSSMRGVSWKESIQRYEANAMRNIIESYRKLHDGENMHRGFVEFILNERGKIRHIRSVHISERVIQKCLCDKILTPIFTNSLIYDNGASIKGKGVHFAIRRFINHMTNFYRQNGNNNGYALSIDFTKYFDNIDHEILFEMIDEKIKNIQIRKLIKSFITVFGDGKSLGLGSQVSQIFAVFYPNKLDHFIKEKLKIKYYGRYMDDLYLIHKDKKYLIYCLNEINKICDILKIKINYKKTCIHKLSQPITFLKGRYSLLPSGCVLRRPTRDSAIRMRRKLVKFKTFIEEGKMSYHDLRTSYQSWRGNYKRRFNAYHRVKFMDRLYYNLFINPH